MNRWKKGLFYIACMLLIAGAYQYRSSKFQQDISGKILRFHVRANSDGRADQLLKLEVRDEIGRFMQNKLQGTDDLQECMDIVQSNLPEIVKIGEEVVVREGYDYSVNAKIAETDFPQKRYGSYIFPAGKYQALVVSLGEGKGQNWWCVMYPNLCFSGSVYEVVDEESQKELEKVLTKEEYGELMAESTIEVKFKYWEKLKELLGTIENISLND